MPEQEDSPKWMRKKRAKIDLPPPGNNGSSVTEQEGREKTEKAEDAPAAAAAALTVIRGMPSRAHVLCELGDEKNLVCYVRRADLFRRGMVLEGARPRPDLGPRAWEYQGKLPRRPGMW